MTEKEFFNGILGLLLFEKFDDEETYREVNLFIEKNFDQIAASTLTALSIYNIEFNELDNSLKIEFDADRGQVLKRINMKIHKTGMDISEGLRSPLKPTFQLISL